MSAPCSQEASECFLGWRSTGACPSEELIASLFSPGSIRIKFVVVWSPGARVLPSQKAAEVLKSYLRKNRNSLLAYPVDQDSIHLQDVFDECRIQKGGCSFDCTWDYDTLTKTCTCRQDTVLLADGKSCGPRPLTRALETVTPNMVSRATSTTTPSAPTRPSPAAPTDVGTTPIPPAMTKAIVAITDLFNNLTTTDSSTDVNETTAQLPDFSTVNEFLPDAATATEEPEQSTAEATTATTEESTLGLADLETVAQTTAETFTPSDSSVSWTTVNDTISKGSITADGVGHNFTDSLETTVSNLELETTTENSPSGSPDGRSEQVELLTTASSYAENESTTHLPVTIQEDLSTIGYHIKEPTTEIYTLKEGTDPVFGPELNDMTAEIPTTSLTTTPHETESTLTTKINSTPEIPKETQTTTNYTDMTTPAGKELEYHTTSNNAEDYFTELLTTTTTFLKEDVVPTTEIPTESVTDFTLPEFTSIETNEQDQSTTTVSFPPVWLSSNKTPEVRSFDEDLENNTLSSSTDFFSAGESTLEPSTEGNETSGSVENLLTSNPATTPVPILATGDETTLPAATTDQSLSAETTEQVVTKIVEETLTVTTDKSKDETIYDDSAIKNTTTEVTVATFPNIFTESSEPSSLNHGLTDVRLETTSEPKITVLLPNEAENTTLLPNETEITTLLPNETETTTLLPTETELETLKVTENTESVSNVSLTNLHDVQTTTVVPLPNVHLENSTINSTDYDASTSNDTEVIKKIPDNTTAAIATTRKLPDVEETTSFVAEMTKPFPDTEETTMNFFTDMAGHVSDTDEITISYAKNASIDILETTIPGFENITPVTATESNTAVAEFSNSSTTTKTTEKSVLQPTSSTINMSNETTTPESFNSTTVILEASDFNETESAEVPGNETTTLDEFTNSTDLNEYTSTAVDFNETYTVTGVQDFTFPSPPTYSNESEIDVTTTTALDSEIYGNDTTIPYDQDSNFTQAINATTENRMEGVNGTLFPGLNELSENGTFFFDGNFTTTDGYDVTNETTTNMSAGIECREDQFFCEPTNTCINDTFMCDGIEDCPDGQDEFQCKDGCHSNFMCGNSTTCIMSDARCDGIWDCENGTDEENCTPTECAKHEVMCLDGSKCIKPGHICDWKYNCLDRSDEVGCIERTTCESSGRFFCNDGLCIPWSLKCDGEHDCKEGEDEGNCTCLNDEFQCEDGKCLPSSSRCDGRKNCHDGDDEMGCVTIDDAQHVVSTYEPYSGTWGLLCAEDWNLDDGHYLCKELGFARALSVERVHVSFNGTWMAMRRENLTEASLWTERVSFVESCISGLAAAVDCQKFACGDFSGLLHRRRRDVISTDSSQWPFIGYTSTFYSNKGCLSEILTPIWLITSAECLLSISKEPFNGSDWYVQTNIGRDIETDLAQNHEVLRIITHPHSSKFRSLTLRDYDLALVRLKHALEFKTDKIGAICPPPEQVPPGITCFAGVLGTEKPRAPPPQVLAINGLALQIQDKRNCNRVEHYNNAVNQRMLCTQSSEGHTICDNDEGTPLMCLTGINEWFLAGMLTYQRYCDVYSKHPAVFSNLFPMKNFLDKVIGQKQYEVPYDSNVYVIIPPTTPSPTMPDTTTTEMATTVNITLMDATNFEVENATEAVSEDLNGTTASGDELGSEYFTTVLPDEYTSNFTALSENETTTTMSYGMELDELNSTLAESEKSNLEFSANQTHDYLTSTLNDTYASDETNITDASVMMNDMTQYDNATLSHLLETTAAPAEFRNLPMSFELNDTSIEFMNMTDFTTAVDADLNGTTGGSADLNEMDMTTIMATDIGASTGNTTENPMTESPTVSVLNSSTEAPLISILNESLEMLKPMIMLSNKSIAMSQPLISLMDKDVDVGTENATDIPTSEPSGNGTETTHLEAALTELTDATQVPVTAADTTTIAPVTNTEVSTVIEITSQPFAEETETFTFDVEGEPDEDLAFSIFRNDEGLKFELYALMENASDSNISDNGINVTQAGEHVNTTTNMSETSILHITTQAYSETGSSLTEKSDLILDNATENTNPASKSTLADSKSYTVPANLEVVTESSTVNESLNAGIHETSTDILKTKIDTAPLQNPTESVILEAETASNIGNESLSMENYKITTGTLETRTDTVLFENATTNPINLDTQPNIGNESLSTGNTETTTNTLATKTEMTPLENLTLPVNLETETQSIIVNESVITGNHETTTDSLTTEIGMALLENPTVPVNIETETPSSIVNEPAITDNHETNTESLATITEMAPLENPTVPVNIETETPSSIVNESVITDNHETTTNSLTIKIGKALLENPTMAENLETETPLSTVNESVNTDNHETTTDSLAIEAETALLENPTVPVHLETKTPSSIVNGSFNIDNHETTTVSPATNIGMSPSENPTVSINSETETQSSILNESTNHETTTESLESKAETSLENPTMKMRLISEESSVLSTSSLPLNSTDCGLWAESFMSSPNNSDVKDLFLRWPALGYLQMVSESKTCPSVVVSSKFVITSLNCLTFSSTDLDPSKWSYVGGLRPSNVTSDDTKNYTVDAIIPRPGTSLSLDENTLALVRVEGAIEASEYSRKACLAEKEVAPGEECFAAGWNRNYSGGGDEQPFYSIPLIVIPSEECNNTLNYNGTLTEDVICATSHQEMDQQCYVEYGSPLFCLNQDKRWEVQGVLRLPSPCDMYQPLAFSSTTNSRNWMVETLKNNKKWPH